MPKAFSQGGHEEYALCPALERVYPDGVALAKALGVGIPIPTATATLLWCVQLLLL
jgi:acetylornithine/succinyldiaminopimelate/putrescine aminotransferase